MEQGSQVHENGVLCNAMIARYIQNQCYEETLIFTTSFQNQWAGMEPGQCTSIALEHATT